MKRQKKTAIRTLSKNKHNYKPLTTIKKVFVITHNITYNIICKY